MKKFITIATLILTFNLQAKLLDKVVGVINDRVITQSELSRIQSTISSRKEISPIVFNKKKYSKEDILEVKIQNYIIKDKLSEIGYNITDESVESQISMTERRNGLTRNDLLRFLKAKSFNFEEYFQLIKNTMEYNLFNSKIISPLVSISDQELKNEYYKTSKKVNAGSFKYNLDLYTVPIASVKVTKTELKVLVEKFIKTGIKENSIKNLELVELGQVKNDDLDSSVSSQLASLAENDLSSVIKKGRAYTMFYIKKKDMTESNEFLKAKGFLQNKLYMSKSKSVIESWFDKERSNYFIQKNI